MLYQVTDDWVPEDELTVRWDDDRSGSTGTTCPPASDDDLDCYTLTVTF